MSDRVVTLSKSYRFAASHRLYAETLSPEENQVIFGKCANPNGHGHNYGLTVTVGGAVDPRTGRVVDLDELDRVVRAHVLDAYDLRHLNYDVEDFVDEVPTGENIVKRIWSRLDGPLGGRLRKITLQETRNNRFEYAG